jgi:hypothetical protein
MSVRRAASILAVALLACTPELEPIRWQGFDADELREAFASPTGVVDEDSANEVAEAIVELEQPYRVLEAYLRLVFAAAEGGDGAAAIRVPRAVEGTNVYLLIACPGPAGSEPFEHGRVRIDSDRLTLAALEQLTIEGQVLLTFEACEIDGWVFEGGGPGHYFAETAELLATPTLTAERLADGALFEVVEPIFYGSDQASALFTLGSGETLTLDWFTDVDELRLRGRNGALLCTTAGGELSCAPP